jgi:DNA-directed RNA polymerase specialized sigma24 family protein
MAEGPPTSGPAGVGGAHGAQHRRVLVAAARPRTATGEHDLTAPSDLNGGLDATLLTAIWRLPSRQREVIALRIFLDLDTATIARQLGIEAGTVRMHLSRGVTALRHELNPTRNMETGQ